MAKKRDVNKRQETRPRPTAKQLQDQVQIPDTSAAVARALFRTRLKEDNK